MNYDSYEGVGLDTMKDFLPVIIINTLNWYQSFVEKEVEVGAFIENSLDAYWGGGGGNKHEDEKEDDGDVFSLKQFEIFREFELLFEVHLKLHLSEQRVSLDVFTDELNRYLEVTSKMSYEAAASMIMIILGALEFENFHAMMERERERRTIALEAAEMMGF
tara:strand:+ start:169 stop:654 length:486 start_codon:yes stop_codon:yes gene_type:complete